MSALECNLLPDGIIMIYHKRTNSERRFSLKEFQIVVTYLLEYYREGTTEFSPLGLPYFPANMFEFYESPKLCENEAVLELWSHRNELYQFVEANRLFQIKYLLVNHIDYWRIVDITTFRNAVKELVSIIDKFMDYMKKGSESKTEEEMREWYAKAREECTRRDQWLIQNYCERVQGYFSSLGFYDAAIKCKSCPFRLTSGERTSCHLFLGSKDEKDEEKVKKAMLEYYEKCLTLYDKHFKLVYG